MIIITQQRIKLFLLSFFSSAWLRNEDSPVIARLSRTIEAITNLSMLTAEDLQVCGNDPGQRRGGHFFVLGSKLWHWRSL